MTAETIVAILAFVTIGAVLVFAIIGKRRIEQRKQDGSVPKSTLAADKDSKGTPVDT
ncbi:hypothetical protein [Pseudoponticoccus marisrubri]|uniref:hypothetical protein n=1 Tax=Pseudoponticoccus marisrubri TaxID=1685382 RepID=UPI0012FD687B|nr:hypothetical protein [Pseudoponticoccus marisrubri]